jgi:hypothetical protein
MSNESQSHNHSAVNLQSRMLSRREVLKGLGAVGALASLGELELEGAARFDPRQSSLIRQENQREGTSDWLLTNTRIDPTTKYRCPWIEGYCSRTSVRPGDELTIYVSTNPKSEFTLDFYRMGFYGGLGGREMLNMGPFRGRVQADPPVGPKRLRECRWEPSTTITIPKDWVSGVYLGKLTASRENLQTYIIFIVRDDRRADFIFQCSDTTWQAYNRWPNQFSLYDNGKEVWWCGPDVDISFDRPYGKYCQILDAPLSIGSGEWFLWEFPLAYWMEAQGYDVTYTSNLDTHSDPHGLRRAQGFLSVGHDEYYSREMYQHLKAAIADGLNVAFLSGNTCCGRIDPRPSSSGVPNRIYGRVDYFGPRDEGMIRRFPTMGAFPYNSEHESLLMGARNVPPCTGGADWICVTPEHWLYEGTEMKEGERIPGLIGWEFHGDPAVISGLKIVATGPTQDAPGRPNGGTYAATVYPGPRRNFVLNASTCWWADGLSQPPGYVRPSVYTSPLGPDPRVQRMTRNLLERMRKSRPPRMASA